MKYSEFEREVEKLGFATKRTISNIYVESTHETVISVNTVTRFSMDTEWTGFSQETEGTLLAVCDLAYQLAKTPPAEREEEKKYYVKLPTITKSMRAVYLVKDTSNLDKVSVDWSNEAFITCGSSMYRFTEQEIKDIDERYLAFKVEVTSE